MNKKLTSKNIFDKISDFTFLLPALLIFSIVIIIPLIKGLNIAFTDWNGVSKDFNYVGFRNFTTMFHDDGLIQPIKNTLYFTIVTTISINVLGLSLAVAFDKAFKGVNALKSIIFMPMVASLVLASIMWTYLFNDFATAIFHIISPLAGTSTVMTGLAIISVWRETGLAMVIYFATLQTIPKEIIEAADIDGANVVQRFFKVKMPFIAPAFTYCIPLWIGTGLRQFDYSMVATKGGPGTSSVSLAMYIYQYLFPYYKTGYGQMIAIVFLVFVCILSYFLTSMLRRREMEA
ncbi:carbohydrate ABC transporter permease [Clostridium lacusfryxellense]|uniref:carbohydrate ABC transporter permease n=1 Tax=Clostridium lacusfryxellense TaxID=205328 RepID=UPI001C0B8F06|nr:sugar ABC transporter permease [Clostridium lacusfryxellense]MBU3113700.1 sugar ABC transporter permease [Clostridium lacusfryxellense]